MNEMIQLLQTCSRINHHPWIQSILIKSPISSTKIFKFTLSNWYYIWLHYFNRVNWNKFKWLLPTFSEDIWMEAAKWFLIQNLLVNGNRPRSRGNINHVTVWPIAARILQPILQRIPPQLTLIQLSVYHNT